MKNLIRDKIRNYLKESNSASKEWNICDDFSVNDYNELITLLKKSNIEQSDWDNIQDLLDELKTGVDNLSNDKDQFNTITHKIATRLCK